MCHATSNLGFTSFWCRVSATISRKHTQKKPLNSKEKQNPRWTFNIENCKFFPYMFDMFPWVSIGGTYIAPVSSLLAQQCNGYSRVGDLETINRRTKLRVVELGHSTLLSLKKTASTHRQGSCWISSSRRGGDSDSHCDSTFRNCFQVFIVAKLWLISDHSLAALSITLKIWRKRKPPECRLFRSSMQMHPDNTSLLSPLKSHAIKHPNKVI